MKSVKIITFVAAALASVVVFAAGHLEVGLTLQDEAVAMAVDEGLTQGRYLAMSYGEDAQKMLDAAFEARGSRFAEGANSVRHFAKGDIRNVPCLEDTAKPQAKPAYMRFMKRHRFVMFNPEMATPVAGRMYGTTGAFTELINDMKSRSGRPVVISGEGKSQFRDVLDPKGISYSFWPLGCAIHAPDAYAEEVSHFFNFMDPKIAPRSFKGTWSTTDMAKVAKWNEFLSALRGVKVYAYSIGYNLNDAPVDDVSVFTAFFNVIKGKMSQWSSGSVKCPLATNAYVLLLAYEEAAGNEGMGTDNGAYKRFRELCRNPEIAKMVL